MILKFIRLLLGISISLVVMMSVAVRVIAGSPYACQPGRYINVRRCGGLSMVLIQLKDPLELFVQKMEFLPGSWFPSRRDMTEAVEIDVKTYSFLPSTMDQVR